MTGSNSTFDDNRPSQTTTGGSGHKQRASEKRKAQNRAAQRTYRSKRSARINELETLVASAGLLDGLKSNNGETSGASGDSANRSSIDEARTDLGPPGTQDLGGVEDLFPSLNDLGSIADPSQQWPIENGASVVLQPSVSASLPLQASENSMPYFVSREISTSQTLLSSTYHYTDLVSSSRNYVADPYANHLRLHTLTLVQACLFNAAHLGIHNLNCCDDTISPLFSPEIGTSDHPLALAQSLQRTFSYIKRDLRPTVAQVTIPHHPYLDVFPFPEVRSRIIELTACDPPLLDEDAFWADSFNNGIVCWGSISTGGGVAPPEGGGAPWDTRSWEAKQWFLTKWSFVVGGDEGELARTSKWWRQMRGVGQGFSF